MTLKRFVSLFVARPSFYSPTISLSTSQKYVPHHEPPEEEEVRSLQGIIDASPKLLILTGAGVSTESGLPDYRSSGVGLFARTTYKPITIQEFLHDERRRQSYWARNFVAWETFSTAKPNDAHYTLASWEEKGRVQALVTQNVDQLHQKAGSRGVIELHGNSFSVGCLKCNYQIPRKDYQEVLTRMNSSFDVKSSVDIRPDGDIFIPQAIVESFQTANCPSCGGLLKPKVVFFGENISMQIIDKIYSAISEADLLLVLGSSLEVYSGFRFVLHALEIGKKVVVINIGPTRADPLRAKVKDQIVFFRRKLTDLLPQITVRQGPP